MTYDPSLIVRVDIEKLAQVEAAGDRPPGTLDQVHRHAINLQGDPPRYARLFRQQWQEILAGAPVTPRMAIHRHHEAVRFPVGSVFKIAIRLITGVEPGPHCRCNERVAVMNRWGATGCLRQRKTIEGWLIEEARSRGHTIDGTGAGRLLIAAWKEWKQHRKAAQQA